MEICLNEVISITNVPSRQSRERDYMKELKSIAVQQDVVTNHPLKATVVVSVSISSEFSACMCTIDFIRIQKVEGNAGLI